MLDKIIRALGSLRLLPLEVIPNRTSSEKIEKSKLKEINERRSKLQVELERVKQENSANKDEIEDLQKKLKAASELYVQVCNDLKNVTLDNEKEENIKQRIETAFGDLKSYTYDINYEKIWARVEMYTFFILSLLVIAFLVYRYFIFISDVEAKKITITTWFNYLPYAGGFTISFLLIWVCVYLKNRANKISVELSSQLFNIHYLEGLLKMANALSKDSATAMEKINKTVDAMLHGYLKQIGTHDFAFKKISDIEDKEMDSNPYWKLLNEIKNLINKE